MRLDRYTSSATYLSTSGIQFAVSEVYDLPAWGNCGLYVPSPVNRTVMYEYAYISNASPPPLEGGSGRIRIRIRNRSASRAVLERDCCVYFVVVPFYVVVRRRYVLSS